MATLSGTLGNDTLYGTTGNDSISGLAGADVIYGFAGDDRLNGGIGNDQIYAGSGNDLLSGGAGADQMRGGPGNDTYMIDDVLDRAIEVSASEGTDTVQTTISFTLGAYLENLTLLGSSGINGIGNSFANVISGNSGANLLDGRGGADTLRGGGGNDTYIVDNAGDQAIEGSATGGTDLVQSSVSFTLGTYVENLTLLGSGAIDGTGNELGNLINGNSGNNHLFGNDGADVIYGRQGDDLIYSGMGDDQLYGGNGNDTLVGDFGADSLRGGAGDDLYIVDSSDDAVLEVSASEGHDKVESYVSFTLGDNVEDLELRGDTSINGTGNSLNNRVFGNDGDNVLDGGAGNDFVLGGLGDDTLIGGDGDDFLEGDNGADFLRGGLGNDHLKGGGGSDSMSGGAGDDIYYVSEVGDDIIENAGAGTDGVNVLIDNYVLPDNVENGAVATSVGLTLTGNSLANDLKGGSDDDRLIGGEGNDAIDGHNGADVLTGGGGADHFNFSRASDSEPGSYDTITDFTSSSGAGAGEDDTLDLHLVDANSLVQGDQVFNYIGGGTFTQTPGELRVDVSTDGNTSEYDFYGDLNGDGTADFSFVVHVQGPVLYTDDMVL